MALRFEVFRRNPVNNLTATLIYGGRDEAQFPEIKMTGALQFAARATLPAESTSPEE